MLDEYSFILLKNIFPFLVRNQQHENTEATGFKPKREYHTVKGSWPATCSTLALSTRRTTIVNNKFRASHFVY